MESQQNLDRLETSSPSQNPMLHEGSMLLMQSLAGVSSEMLDVEKALVDLIPAKTDSTRNIVEHVFSAGGKRIRPAIFLLCAKMLQLKSKQLVTVACICEYVHTASLLHDDVIDSSSVRRNKPTSNSIWGDQSAVLVGDLIYARACQLMAQTGCIGVVENFSAAITEMSEGELLQLENIFDLSIDTQVYFQILNRKTGVLIGASCKAAGILAKANPDQCQALMDFGSSVGVAFQLIDDALDYRATTEEFGKPILSDFKEGKVTYPVILLREVASLEEISFLKECLGEPKELTEAHLVKVHHLVEKYDTVEKTFALACEYTKQGLVSLKENFEASPEREAIERLGEFLVSRSS